MANGQGGKIYIGVNDKGIVIGAKDVEKLLVNLPNKIRNAIGIVAEVNHLVEDGKEYIEIYVQPHPFPVSCHGKYYLRSGSTLQLLSGSSLDEFMLRKQGITWDRVPVPYVTVDDLSDKAVELFKKVVWIAILKMIPKVNLSIALTCLRMLILPTQRFCYSIKIPRNMFSVPL